ncbi:hypothetical protein QBC38DRAFT_103769 [Podospora fimiseda]|uniref:Uncharacterized protein n=1 Tax=Podospora fimiseda TaxID=252190 RepID=A0AAN7BU04_9PEZI|nr:hypothetical protein QBC38DRAFT_103769 [Podospora fimiseda]
MASTGGSTVAPAFSATAAISTVSLEPQESLNVVEPPTSPSSGLALSRFEFETGRGNEGTKIIMVEWDASILGQESRASDWEISWDGKKSVLSVQDADPDSTGSTHRTYFLLPTGATVPALINITYAGTADNKRATLPVLRTKPMPAIFPAELTSTQETGSRGVLHTVWAKRRLAELQEEIEAELKTNDESVGLEMAAQERQWIVDHFGLGPDHGVPQPTRLHIPQPNTGPTSPRSPVGGKLGEKLRGLKLATSPAELAAASQASKESHRLQTQPLNISSNITIPPLLPGRPSISGESGVASLDAIVGGGFTSSSTGKQDDTTEEDLFALPMSPRSPEMKRSPFSIL